MYTCIYFTHITTTQANLKIVDSGRVTTLNRHSRRRIDSVWSTYDYAIHISALFYLLTRFVFKFSILLSLEQISSVPCPNSAWILRVLRWRNGLVSIRPLASQPLWNPLEKSNRSCPHPRYALHIHFYQLTFGICPTNLFHLLGMCFLFYWYTENCHCRILVEKNSTLVPYAHSLCLLCSFRTTFSILKKSPAC